MCISKTTLFRAARPSRHHCALPWQDPAQKTGTENRPKAQFQPSPSLCCLGGHCSTFSHPLRLSPSPIPSLSLSSPSFSPFLSNLFSLALSLSISLCLPLDWFCCSALSPVTAVLCQRLAVLDAVMTGAQNSSPLTVYFVCVTQIEKRTVFEWVINTQRMYYLCADLGP